MDLSSSIPLSGRKLSINFIGIAFWIIFALNYFYLNRLLIVVSNDKFRLGVIVLGLSVFAILVYLRAVKDSVLVFLLLLFSFVSFYSAWSNNISWLQFLAFIRIPILVYLIFNLVRVYLNSNERIESVVRILYFIAVLQLPIIAFQRFIYPYLPERLILGLSSTDFGMGTFTGDTAMAFTLVGLVIFLLFDHNVIRIIKQRWLLAVWLSLTILFSNSQIQHITIILIWGIYFVSHLKLNNIILGLVSVVVITGLIILLSQSSLMTYPLIQRTFTRLSEVSQVFDDNPDYERLLEGRQARGAAISYYLNQPIKWTGDGPGSVYDTSTGERSIGGWGHIYTFYAEVGIIGLALSLLIFFVIAFPIHIGKSTLRIRVSWVPVLLFIAIILVTLVKYPLGNTAILFTYCILIIGNRVLSARTLVQD